MGELDGYVLRYGTEKDIESMSNELVVEDGQSMELKITGLDRGTWYFAMRSVDVDGLKSQWSSVVSKTIN
ncbi:fibronectin type III domain-containing protein [Marinobacter sp. NFXS9]